MEVGKWNSVGVTGTAPERFLSETSKNFSKDWLKRGIELLKELKLKRRLWKQSREVNAVEIGPEKLLWKKSKFWIQWREKSEGGRETVK